MKRRVGTEALRKRFLRLAGGWIAALALAVGMAGCALHRAAGSSEAIIPVAPVRRGGFQLEVHATGVLRATHSVSLFAPPIGGGSLQIIRLLPDGTPVKAGQVVVAFDPSQQEYNLAQSRSDYEQARQAIIQAKDKAAVQVAEDRTALLRAEFAVRQAQLKVRMNELLSAIQAKENVLALDAARQSLAQTRQDIKSHAASNQATLTLDEQKEAKAHLAMLEAQQNISKLQVRAPISGLMVVMENRGSSGIFFFGQTSPEFQVGDQLNPGTMFAQVIDTSRMEVSAQIPQSGRANVQTGDLAEVHVDALPGVIFRGKVASIAGVASGLFGAGLNAEVKVMITLDRADPRLRPGYSARLVVFGRRLKNALLVPREAVFHLTGTPSVYVKKGSGFARRHVKIRYLTASTAVIGGLAPGTKVALINPEANNNAASQTAAAAPALGSGGS